jgi:hypothetical protein
MLEITTKTKHLSLPERKDRYMRFQTVFIRLIYSNCVLKEQILQRSDKCVETSVYSQFALTEVAMLIWNRTLTDPLPYQTLHQQKFCLFCQGSKYVSNLLSSFNYIPFSISFDSLFSTLSVFKLKYFIDITNIVQIVIYI